MASEQETNVFRLFVVDLQTQQQYLGTEVEKRFGSKEVIIKGIDKVFDFSDINTFDELTNKYNNFKALAYAIGRKPTQAAY